jgi:hypothetical protein
VIPLYGFLEGDTLGLVVLARPEQTVAELGQALVQAARVRVAPGGRPAVLYRGEVLDDATTVAEAQLGPLDRFDVRFDARGAGAEASD